MTKELYVGNLPQEAGEEDLKRLFSVAGTVTSVHIITDPESGSSKGCAYVRMATVEDAREAIESLNEALMGNRIITVSEARPQQRKTASAGARNVKHRNTGRFPGGKK